MDLELIWLFCCLTMWQTSVVLGHGRLRQPPSRSTMWRYGFRAPPNYNDHELNCGGFGNLWSRNEGRCGVCGDPYQDPRPRLNEGGGKYGKGVIVKEYTQGEIITAEVEITANHKGYFEFSICSHNQPLQPADEECFQLLQLADGSGIRWQLNDDVTPKRYHVALRLPVDMTCSQCVFRWYWKSGNNWGTEGGRSGLGYGPQETFIACSDVSITPGENGEDQPRRRPLIGGARQPTENSGTSPRIGGGASGRRPSVEIETEDDHGHHESEIVNDVPAGSCRSIGMWRSVEGMDQWCVTNCAMSFCPASHCCCNC